MLLLALEKVRIVRITLLFLRFLTPDKKKSPTKISHHPIAGENFPLYQLTLFKNNDLHFNEACFNPYQPDTLKITDRAKLN